MRLLTLLTIPLVLACASATKTTAGDKCASLPGDTVYTRLKPAYRACNVSSAASVIPPHPRVDYTPAPTSKPPACSSVEVEYVVDENGMVEVPTARIVKTTNPQLADAYMAILPALRYQPAKLDGKPVRQIVSDGTTLMTQVVSAPKGSAPSRGTSPPSRVPTTC